jgi:hypothetical protein
MGDKIKPWHDRKPKHGNKDHKRKRVAPLTVDNGRVSPLLVNDGREYSLTIDDEDWGDEVSWKT